MNAVGEVVVDQIVRNRVGRSARVNTVILITLRRRRGTGCEAPVVTNDIAIDENSGAGRQNALATNTIIMNPIPPNRQIMAAVNLHPIPAIADLKALNRDPADGHIEPALIHNDDAIKGPPRG